MSTTIPKAIAKTTNPIATNITVVNSTGKSLSISTIIPKNGPEANRVAIIFLLEILYR